MIQPRVDAVVIPATTITTAEDSTITQCVTVSNVDGGVLIANLTCGPNHGTATTTVTGNVVCVTYVPSANYNGNDTLCLTVCNGTNCDTVKVPVVVTPVNDSTVIIIVTPPIAVKDTITSHGEGVIINVLANDINGTGGTITIITPPHNGQAVVNTNGTITYVPNNESCGLDSIQYNLCNTAGCSSAWVYITTICNEFFVPEGFSPNGDGVNDMFIIKGLNNYPNNTLTFFNRWGNEVYAVTNYQNDWNATSNKGLRVGGELLPVGTYFYILDLGVDGKAPIKGYVYINR